MGSVEYLINSIPKAGLPKAGLPKAGLPKAGLHTVGLPKADVAAMDTFDPVLGPVAA